ncbi:MAG: amidohydrolase family protein [Chloroflexi bacterium]|nr:amidohydrolase family protein [Chloroflexota bacterium]
MDVDIAVQGEVISAVGRGLSAAGGPVLEAAGKLVLPAFIDTHIHLDKVLIREDVREHDGTLAGAIGAIQRRKARYTVEDVRRRAREVIESGVRTGTTRFRSHVDVDTIGRLIPLEGVMAAASDTADIAEVRTIAFPQEGILRDPGSADLLRAALELGADVMGGMPHWETSVDDQREHVRICFDLAERFDRDLDMHVDETDDGAVRTLEMVADEALGRGWHGRVTAGHVCALAAADEEYSRRVIDKCARAGITIVSNPVTNLVIQGRGDHGLIRRGSTRVAEFRRAGVNVAFGQDCVKDGFYPFGRADMLEVLLVSAHATHLTTEADLLFGLRAITDAPARAWRLGDYGLRPGARADFQLLSSSDWSEALRRQEAARRVWFRGREVASTETIARLRGQLSRAE